MLSIRRLLYKPKKTDTYLLSQFYYADEDLCAVAVELDSFDGRKNPERCAALVSRLRQCQDQVLRLIQLMMNDAIKDKLALRDFRIKYPDDLIQEGLSGQLWFGAECLAAGSSILNREVESTSMRPLAKSLTKQLDILRQLLKEQSLRNPTCYTDRIKAAFVQFDNSFADFELSYVSAMVPVKSMKEYDKSQDVAVLFSETVLRSISSGLITSEMIDVYDPALMFTIPRLAIVSGLIIFPEGPLNPDQKTADMSEMFRPFQSLLHRIRELLWSLSSEELQQLEKTLCNLEAKDTVPAENSSPKNSTPPSSKMRRARKARKHKFNRLNSDIPEARIHHDLSDMTDLTSDPQQAFLASGPSPLLTSSSRSSQFAFSVPGRKERIVLDRALSQDEGTTVRSKSAASRQDQGSTSLPASSSSSSDTDSACDDLIKSSDQLISTAKSNEQCQISRKRDLIHKLFVCISGVADQLQTNFASDLRNILKSVFSLHGGDDAGDIPEVTEPPEDNPLSTEQEHQTPPTWLPDNQSLHCCACKLPFTFTRRRHHCRNCGLIFCGRCSCNSAPLPMFGYNTPVRICNRCYVYQVDPFTVGQQETDDTTD